MTEDDEILDYEEALYEYRYQCYKRRIRKELAQDDEYEHDSDV